MIKQYKYDNYDMDSAEDQQFIKQNQKVACISHQNEQCSTASSSDSDEENNMIIFNGQLKNTLCENETTEQSTDPQHLIQKDRYKTELCRNFQNYGTCNYGKKCQYAHGKHELHQKPERKTNQFYKTRPCKEFFNTLTCPFGQRCKYNHDVRKYTEITKPNTFYQKKLLIISNEVQQQSLKINASSTSQRLPFFSNNFNLQQENNQDLDEILTTSTLSFLDDDVIENEQNIKQSKNQTSISEDIANLSAYLSQTTTKPFFNNKPQFQQGKQPIINLLPQNYFQSW